MRNETMQYCKRHDQHFGGSKGECLLCVKEERDELTADLAEAREAIERVREHLGTYDSGTIHDWTDDIVHEFYAGFEALLSAPATNDGYKHCKICGGKMCLDEDTWLCRGCPQTPAPATPEALRELTPEEAATCPKLTDEQIREALNKGWDESGFGDPAPATGKAGE